MLISPRKCHVKHKLDGLRIVVAGAGGLYKDLVTSAALGVPLKTVVSGGWKFCFSAGLKSAEELGCRSRVQR